MIDSPLTNDVKDKVCTMDTEIRGEDVNNCQKQNGQGQCNGSYLNGTHQILEHKGIGGVLCHEGNCGEEKSSRVPCDGEIESDTIPKKRRHLEEMTFQDIYKEDYDDDDDDDEDSDWAPSQVVIEKWFCTNCTMVNDDDVLHCDVCGEYKDSEILRHGYFASDVAQEADHIPIKSEVRDKYKDLSILKLGTDNQTAVGFDERMLLHSEMEMKSHPHPERPDRLRAIAASLSTAGIFPGRCIPVSAREIMKEELEMVHSLEHIEAVESTSTMLSSYFTSDTYANEHSACAARLAAGLCADLSSTIMAGDAKNGFALVRPPGHHAGVKDVMGFCLHNNAAVAALAAQRANAKKVLILDWDVHHGNGTQEIFEANKSVLYISMHRHEGGRFYPGTGAAVEVGSMGAEGYCVNIPWKCGGVGDNDYIFAFQHIVLPIALEFAPDFTIISAGFDAARGDPLGCCDVTPSGFARMTHLLSALSDGKLLVILEGGYNLRSISSSATAVIKVLLGETPECEPDVVLPTKAGLRTVMEVLQIQMKYWPKLEAHLTRLQSQWPSVSFKSHKLVINKRTKREVIEKFAKLTRAQKQEKLPEVAHYFVKQGGRVVREKRRNQKERARGLAVGESSGEVAMEKRKSNLVTREDRNLGRVGPKRPSGGAGASGAGGSSKRPEGGGGSSSSPLDLEVISFKPRERSSSLKRKADMSEQQAAKIAKAARHVLGDSSEVGGASGGERVGGKTTRSTKSRPAPLLDLETFGVGQSSLPAPREPSSSAKLKAPSMVSGKSIMADDDLERQVVYVDDQGVQRIVKRTDVSFKSSKIASCLLDHISLDGSRKELDTKGLADNLRQMDMALCLLVSGYQKLKEIALIAESDKESVTKLKEELQNVQDAYSVDREDFEALKKEHQGVCLAKLLMGTELEDAKLKLHAAEEKLDAANAEIVRVTGYAQHCKDVAQQAITAYDVLDADFLELEAEYKVFREEHECGAPSTTVLNVPGDACDAHVLPGTAMEVAESQI